MPYLSMLLNIRESIALSYFEDNISPTLGLLKYQISAFYQDFDPNGATSDSVIYIVKSGSFGYA
jgi:hypothetical protein